MDAAAAPGYPTGTRSALRAAVPDLVAALVLFAVWLCVRPYRGIRHDAVVYAGQVLHRLQPDRFAGDPFFLFGSQDRWSLFSTLMAPMVERFGFAGLEAICLVLCQLAFALACWQLVCDWPSRTLRWAALGAMIVVPHAYGALGVLGYAEPFLTARSFAEPLAIGALALLIQRRYLGALALAAAASAFHPLLTLPVLFIGWIWLVLDHRAWAWLGVALVVPALAGAFGVAPFSALWERFDPVWLKAVTQVNALAFIANTTPLDWMPVVLDAIVLFLLARSTPNEALRRLVQAIFIAVPIATIAWGIGADVLHDVLITQAQLGRIHWPMHLLAALALPVVVVQTWQGGATGRWAASALCLAALAVASNWPTGWLCVIWAVLALAAVGARAALTPGIARLALSVSCIAMVVISGKVLQMTWQAVTLTPQSFEGIGRSSVILSLPFVGALLAAGLLAGMRRPGGLPTVALIAAALGVFGATAWDERTAWQRLLEAGPPGGVRLFDDVLPADASTYWQGEHMFAAWMLAGRGAYFDSDQGGGLLFNRGTALEFTRRRAVMFPLELQQEMCSQISSLVSGAPASATCDVPPVIIDGVCAASGAPDYLVLTVPATSRPLLAQWHPPAAVAAHGGSSFYLYRCAVAKEPGVPVHAIPS